MPAIIGEDSTATFAPAKALAVAISTTTNNCIDSFINNLIRVFLDTPVNCKQ